MIDWAVVAAFIGPLITALAAVAGLFAWLGRKRDARVSLQIDGVTGRLEANQSAMQAQIAQVTASQEQQQAHLSRQDEVLSAALQSIARIEGRLAGPLQVTMREAS